MPFRKSTSEKVLDAAAEAFVATKERVVPLLEEAVDRAAPAAEAVQTAREKVRDAEVRETVVAASAPATRKVRREVKRATKSARKAEPTKEELVDRVEPVKEQVAAYAAPAVERVQHVGLSRADVQGLFAEEWFPRIKDAIAAAGVATTAAAARLPEPAQEVVGKVVPVTVKRKRKGKLLIAVGLLALAGAGAIYYNGQQKQAGDPWQRPGGGNLADPSVQDGPGAAEGHAGLADAVPLVDDRASHGRHAAD